MAPDPSVASTPTVGRIVGALVLRHIVGALMLPYILLNQVVYHPTFWRAQHLGFVPAALASCGVRGDA